MIFDMNYFGLSFYKQSDVAKKVLKFFPGYETYRVFDILNDVNDNTNYSKKDKFGRELVSYCPTFNEAVIDLGYGDKNDGHCFTNIMDFTSYGLFRGRSIQFLNAVSRGINKTFSDYPNCQRKSFWADINNSDHCTVMFRKRKNYNEFMSKMYSNLKLPVRKN